MTTWDWWRDVQNGADFKSVIEFARAKDADRNIDERFICIPRDLAAYVHVDQLYQAYLNAALILLRQGAAFDRGLPEPSRIGNAITRDSFATFGGPHVLAAVTEVSSRALKAVRRQKFRADVPLRRLGQPIWNPLFTRADVPLHRLGQPIWNPL